MLVSKVSTFEREPLLAEIHPVVDSENGAVDECDDDDAIARQKPSSRRVAGTLGLLMIGVFIANAEGSIVLASYARISSAFDALENASWLVTSYVLAMSVAMPVYGKLSDIFGRSSVLMVASGLFALGNLVCGLAPSFWLVVIGRVVSGFGGAGLHSLVSIIITDLVPIEEIGSWRGYVGVVMTAGRASGGPIGGYLTDSVGWRWSFLGQCPPILLTILLVWFFIPNQPLVSTKRPVQAIEKLARIDFVGSLLLGCAILLLLFPLEMGGTLLPWTHPALGVLFAGSLVVGVAYVLYEELGAAEPILAPRLLAKRCVLVSNAVMFCQAAAQLGMMYTVPMYFQITQGVSPTVAGAYLLPAVGGVTVGGLVGGYLTKRSTHYRLMLALATLTSSSCYLLLALRWGTHMQPWEASYIVLGGLGNGLVLSVAFTSLTSGLHADDLAAATSSSYLASMLGTTVGLAATSAVIQTYLKTGLKRALEGKARREEIIEGALSSIEFVLGLKGGVREVIVEVYCQAFKYAHESNLAFSLLAFAASLWIDS